MQLPHRQSGRRRRQERDKRWDASRGVHMRSNDALPGRALPVNKVKQEAQCCCEDASLASHTRVSASPGKIWSKRPEPRCVGCAAIPGPCLRVYDNAVDADRVRGWTPSLGRVQTVVTTDHRNMD